jgi:hypothetical protein
MHYLFIKLIQFSIINALVGRGHIIKNPLGMYGQHHIADLGALLG